MKKGELIGKIFGIALVLVLVGAVLTTVLPLGAPGKSKVSAQEGVSYIIVHALNLEGIEIASIEGMNPNCVEIYDGDILIGYGAHNEETYNNPIGISPGAHTIKVKFNDITLEKEIDIQEGETEVVVFVFDRTEFDLAGWINSKNWEASAEHDWEGYIDMPVSERYIDFELGEQSGRFTYDPGNFYYPLRECSGHAEASISFSAVGWKTHYEVDGYFKVLSNWNSNLQHFYVKLTLDGWPRLSSDVDGFPPEQPFDGWFIQSFVSEEREGGTLTLKDEAGWGHLVLSTYGDDGYRIRFLPTRHFVSAVVAFPAPPYNQVKVEEYITYYEVGESWSDIEEVNYEVTVENQRMSSVPYDLTGTGIKYEEIQPPVASFTYSPQDPMVDEELTFDASSSYSYDPDGEIVSYSWDFDASDGIQVDAEGEFVTHAYSEAGEYTVTLTVIDDNGMTNTNSQAVKVVAVAFMLTFDDGPVVGKTDKVVAALRNIYADDGKPVKAGFFMVGDNHPYYHAWYEPWWNKGSVKESPALVREVAKAGHTIGSHTQHHAWFGWWNYWDPFEPRRLMLRAEYASLADFVKAEITQADAEIENVLGSSTKLFRVPYLYNDPDDRAEIQKGAEGYTIVWGQLTDDTRPFVSAERVKKKAEAILNSWKQDEPAVLIFHDIRPATYNHIGKIVSYLTEEKGFTLVHFDPDRIEDQKTKPTSPAISGLARSPVDLSITGPDGLVLNKQVNQIPGAVYEEADFDGDGSVDDFFVIPEPKTGDYQIQVIPEVGVLPGDVYSLDVEDGQRLITLANDTPITEIPEQPYSVRVTEEGIQMIPATIDFHPDVLNLKAKMKYVTAHIELPIGYDVSQIDISSIWLNGTIPALTKPTAIGDYDGDSIPDLMVKFDRAAVSGLLTPSGQVEITVTGEVAGIAFEGTDTIRVIDPTRYSLDISSTIGGSVTVPGEETFSYKGGTVVSLVAIPDAGYVFDKWIGDVGTIADDKNPTTTITINGDYTITASFKELPEQPTTLIIGTARDTDEDLAHFEMAHAGPVMREFVEQVNLAGGVHLSAYDTATETCYVPLEIDRREINVATWDIGDVTAEICADIANGDVHFLFGGPGTDCIITQAPIANEAGVVLLTLEGGSASIRNNPDKLASWPYVFITLSYSDWYQLPVLSDILEAELGRTPKAYVAHIVGEHGEEYLAVAEDNFDVVGDVEVPYTITQEEANTVIQNAITALGDPADPNYDIFCGFCYPHVVQLLTQASIDKNFNPPAMVFSVGTNYGWYPYRYGDPPDPSLVEGIMGFTAASYDTNAEIQAVYDLIAERFDDDEGDPMSDWPDMPGFPGILLLDYWGTPLYWAGMEMWLEAVESVGYVDQELLRDALAALEDDPADTILGECWFRMYGAPGEGGGNLDYLCHTGEIGQWQSGAYETVGYEGITDDLPNYVVTADFMFPMTDQWNWLP